ncbi:MAG TPA: methionyl-tRNA formyltransferase [bacterium]|nr:methionyl-tRNA formyltransferase [bacterium]
MRVIFMGTPEFAVPALRALVRAGHEVPLTVTQPDRPRGRKAAPAPPPVKTVAREMGLAVTQPERMTEPGVLETLRDARPDAIVVVAFGHILRREVLALPPRGCINGHASLLPRYRGAAPIQWAIANGETVTGVTTMLMTEGLDSGPILLQRELAIAPDDTGGSLHDKLAPMAAELIVETLAGLAAATIVPNPQDHALTTYAPMLKKEDGKIDWAMPAASLALFVRAFDPWPGTYTFMHGAQLKITKAGVGGGRKEGTPGTVLAADKDGIVVACGEGSLSILELQPAGKRRMKAAEFLAGHPLHPGDRLGV